MDTLMLTVVGNNDGRRLSVEHLSNIRQKLLQQPTNKLLVLLSGNNIDFVWMRADTRSFIRFITPIIHVAFSYPHACCGQR